MSLIYNAMVRLGLQRHDWSLMIPANGSGLFFRCLRCGQEFHGSQGLGGGIYDVWMNGRVPGPKACRPRKGLTEEMA